jgi:hypothetical protein
MEEPVEIELEWTACGEPIEEKSFLRCRIVTIGRKSTMSRGSYLCATCGQSHEGLPFSFAADFPDPYANLPHDQRDSRAVIGTDQCIIDEQQFFLRGCLEIPIIGQAEPFLWGIWASVRAEIFDEVASTWELQGREKTHGPFKGRLANSIRDYPETLNLKLNIVLQSVGTRPLFYVEESEHPLAQEQQHGISYQQAMERASFSLHHRRTLRD